MSTTDRGELTTLLHRTKDLFQSMSRSIRWTSSDAEHLDSFIGDKIFLKDLENRVVRATGERLLLGAVPAFLAYKAWQRTKVVYSFNREFLALMSQTEDTTISISLLERLPFRDMLFTFPKDNFPIYKNEEIAGLYVHVENHDGVLQSMFQFLNRSTTNIGEIIPDCSCAFPFSDGTKISEVFETEQYQTGVQNSRLNMVYDHKLTSDEIDESLAILKKVLNTTIHLMYYLASKDADIKPIKRHKLTKASSKTKKIEIPASVVHEVGSKYEEIIYRRLKEKALSKDVDKETDEQNENVVCQTLGESKSRRPHVRRAHWQHYWTGAGRTKLEVRWKLDLFVGTNQEDQPIVVYEKDSLKGKRNPNTSKKKQKRLQS